jgi:hypothetical protein
VRGEAKQKGELLAAGADSIWLLRGDTIVSVATTHIRNVEVERHSFTGRRMMGIMAGAGLVYGIALGVACSSYEGGGDCGSVALGTMALYVGAGSVWALSTMYSSKYRFSPSRWDEIRAFARFPQGIPDSVRAVGTLAPRAAKSGR